MSVPKLDALAVALREFGGRKRVVPEGLPAEQARKAAGLQAQGRDFFAGTPALKAALVTRIKGALSGGRITAAAWDAEVAAAVRDHVDHRFDASGADVTLAPLSPAYRALKARKGLDPRTGIATGALRLALRAARWTTRTT